MNKQLLCFVLSVLCCVLIGKAQQKGDFELGGNIGLNSSNLQVSSYQYGYNYNITTDSKNDFNLAFTSEYYFSDRWGIKAKMIYDKKGFVGFVNDFNKYSEFTLSYLTIPVMANWHFGSTRKWYLNFGLYTGFLLDAEMEVYKSLDISNTFNSFDIGLALGIGYKFPVSEKIKLFFELDMQGGFQNVLPENNQISGKNSRSALNFGILFTTK